MRLYAAAAVGVGLCWGQAGFLPLGQGVVLWLCGVSLRPRLHRLSGSSDHCRSGAAVRALVSGLLAYVIGSVVFRRPGESGAYFSMITLALSSARVSDRDQLEFGHRRLQRPQGNSGPSRLGRFLRRLLCLGRDVACRAGVRRLALHRADRCAVAGAGAERTPAPAFRLQHQPAEVRRVWRERADGRNRRRDLRAAARHRHAAGRRLWPLCRSRDLGRGRRPGEFARAR